MKFHNLNHNIKFQISQNKISSPGDETHKKFIAEELIKELIITIILT